VVVAVRTEELDHSAFETRWVVVPVFVGIEVSMTIVFVWMLVPMIVLTMVVLVVAAQAVAHALISEMIW